MKEFDVTPNAPARAAAPPSMESAQALPKVGALCAQWVRCGTAGCRCTRGELHGPYFYRFWREEGRLRKRYVRLDDVPAVRHEIETHRMHDQHVRHVVARGWINWRQLAAQVQEMERHGQ
jgi:hypothetical protein